MRFTTLRPQRKPFRCEMVDILEGEEDFPENGEKGDFQKVSKSDFERIPGFPAFYRAKKWMLTNRTF